MTAAPAEGLRVCFITTGLSTGGAEMMLLKLLTAAPAAQLAPTVISLLDEGTVGPRLKALGVPVHAVNLKGSPWGAALRLRRYLRRARPQLVQGWMYHGNLAASVARGTGSGSWPLLWSVRQSLYDLAKERALTAQVIRAGAWLSARSPQAIIYNSHVAARQHEALGYAADRSVVIPNGFETDHFAPRSDARAAFRAELGISGDTLVVGLSARFHAMKGHADFLRAAALLEREGRDLHFVLVGKGADMANPAIADLITASGIASSVTTLGERADVHRIYAGFDIACSASSWGEGFPNVIGEAMACEVPCVVTDVGDSAALVATTGIPVPPGQPVALAGAIGTLAAMDTETRRTLGRAARRRICEHFSIDAVTQQYLGLYAGTIANAPRTVSAR